MRARIVMPIVLLFTALVVFAGDIPDRPEKLNFPAISFKVPDADSLRVELVNGIPVYILEDRQFPLVSVQLYFRGGQYLEPVGKEGLADLTGTVWRTGGAGDLGPAELDEELDFLAARLGTSLGGTNGSVSLNLLSKDLDRGLQLFMDVLLRPRFDEARLAKSRDDLLAGMKERNDSTAAIEGREWSRLIYGGDYWINRLATKASVDSIQPADLIAFHERLLNPKDIVLAVVGDFDRSEMIARLNQTVGSIGDRGQIAPAVPQPSHAVKPGVYLVDKPEVNQGRVSIGHLGLLRPVPEEFSLTVGNDILGGGGFTSWIMSRVRSDEGLAYSAGSSFGINNTYPGTFRAYFQSKSSTCARAAQISIDLMKKLRDEGVGQEELNTSRNSFVQTFPNRFESAVQTVALFASDELVGRPHEYWTEYRDNVSRVDQASIESAARTFIHPDQLVILVVGNVEEILKGHPDHPEASFQNFGELTRIPLRDPMPLEPIKP